MATDPTYDAMLVLISRVSEMQLDQGKSLVQQTKDQHEITRTLAILNTRLEPLSAMANEFITLRLLVNDNVVAVRAHKQALDEISGFVESLKTSNATRSGWESVTGRLGMLAIGALIAALMAYLVPGHV